MDRPLVEAALRVLSAYVRQSTPAERDLNTIRAQSRPGNPTAPHALAREIVRREIAARHSENPDDLAEAV